jgi:hypothetical protein
MKTKLSFFCHLDMQTEVLAVFCCLLGTCKTGLSRGLYFLSFSIVSR